MKKIIFLVGTFFISEIALSSPVPKGCYTSAEFATKSFAEKDRYDDGGFETIGCHWMPNGRVIGCKISASKGGGEAMDTYFAVFNSTCTQLFRIELASEE